MLDISTREKSPRVFEVALDGRLNNLTYEKLEKALRPILDSHPRAVQFDLERLDYVSSMGLRVILVAMKELRAVNGQLFLMQMQAPVKRVFEIANLLPEMSVFASVEEADHYFDAIQRKQQDA